MSNLFPSLEMFKQCFGEHTQTEATPQSKENYSNFESNCIFPAQHSMSDTAFPANAPFNVASDSGLSSGISFSSACSNKAASNNDG